MFIFYLKYYFLFGYMIRKVLYDFSIYIVRNFYSFFGIYDFFSWFLNMMFVIYLIYDVYRCLINFGVLIGVGLIIWCLYDYLINVEWILLLYYVWFG